MGLFLIRKKFCEISDEVTTDAVTQLTYTDGTTRNVDLYGNIDDSMVGDDTITKYIFNVTRIPLEES